MRFLLPIALFTAAAAASCTPHLSTPLNDIPKLTSLEDVMANQAAAADPQWGKIGAASYTDADWPAFTALSERIQATSAKIKDFSKGPEFDGFAVKLGVKAKALGDAAGAKNAAGASDALKEMKAACKECHSKFK
jgi:Cytochrome C'